jgi:membrane-bound lytic murein transglycosylase D
VRAVAADVQLACLRAADIDAWERTLRTDPAYRNATTDALARGAAWLPGMRARFAAAGMPDALALLPILESGFRPLALEPTGRARGLWQFEAATARDLGLVVSPARDDRVHPERSTEAAIRLLARHWSHFGDWPLAIAAYNAGGQRVDRAVAQHPGATVWELLDRGFLPQTTRDFVARFLATVRFVDGARSCRVPA